MIMKGCDPGGTFSTSLSLSVFAGVVQDIQRHYGVTDSGIGLLQTGETEPHFLTVRRRSSRERARTHSVAAAALRAGLPAPPQ